ncbi:MAG: SirB2 family protein [Gammaproteobacteria bacterium]|nr:SirB2 family protein [Gammaproteobacteria bacterium]
MYTLIKYVHLIAVVTSLCLFQLRMYWRWRTPERLAWGWVRVMPHVIDTVLLAAGLALAVEIHQYPLVDGWLTAKFFALIAYIVLGTIALKRGRSPRVRTGAWLAATLSFAYIIAVAMAKRPWPLSL